MKTISYYKLLWSMLLFFQFGQIKFVFYIIENKIRMLKEINIVLFLQIYRIYVENWFFKIYVSLANAAQRSWIFAKRQSEKWLQSIKGFFQSMGTETQAQRYHSSWYVYLW